MIRCRPRVMSRSVQLCVFSVTGQSAVSYLTVFPLQYWTECGGLFYVSDH